MNRRLGYLGPEGTFSAQAAHLYAQQAGLYNVTFVPHRTIGDVLAATAAGEVDLGLAPVENSIEGTVTITLDFLTHDADLLVSGEVVIPIRHFLLTLPHTALADVDIICSHPQALAQCRQHLAELLPQAVQQTADSTAEAARQVRALGDHSRAAVGTVLAAELNNLAIAAADIQDTPGNATRFLVVGGRPPAASGADKTSLVFGVSDQPGTLFRALQVFAARNINLSKLESRPAKRDLGDYLFYVDLLGHQSDPVVVDALAALKQNSTFLKVFGSYPRAAGGYK